MAVTNSGYPLEAVHPSDEDQLQGTPEMTQRYRNRADTATASMY
jgi:hypothetical protein